MASVTAAGFRLGTLFAPRAIVEVEGGKCVHARPLAPVSRQAGEAAPNASPKHFLPSTSIVASHGAKMRAEPKASGWAGADLEEADESKYASVG
jgi:hypothetical protein